MKTIHYAIRRLENFLKENPSTDWARDWIDCLSFYCGCPECMKILKSHDVDVQMLDGIFG